MRAAIAAMMLALAGLASPALAADPVPMIVPAVQVATDALSTPLTSQPNRFETLAAAIAAQDAAVADEATRCLAGAIYFESKGEPFDGQLAVAEVIINRARSGRFPADLCEVVKQHGQFSFVHGGVIPTVDTARASYRTALAIAKVAMVKAWESSASHALYFHARRIAASARWVMVAAIGNHIFYR
ncbi:cell wall hydrolase [Sphingomonas bacterium]|uniref:cell wall hydrolase n=1 Tax=Sphingomonas bacterium TaxID=1895847 RepID=UPI0020C6E082|nr:cell wall hydrolase [Sphingomonas bacterium]